MDVGHDPNIWTEVRGWLHIVWASVAGLAGWAYTSTNRRLGEVEHKCTVIAETNQRALNEHMIQAAKEYLTKHETQAMVDRTVRPMQETMHRLEQKVDRLLETTSSNHANRFKQDE